MVIKLVGNPSKTLREEGMYKEKEIRWVKN